MTVVGVEGMEDSESPQRNYVVAVQEQGVGGVVKWEINATSPLEAIERVLYKTDTISREPASAREQLRQLGQDLLEIASVGGMPDTYFRTDQRIRRACTAMGLSVSQGWEWVQRL